MGYVIAQFFTIFFHSFLKKIQKIAKNKKNKYIYIYIYIFNEFALFFAFQNLFKRIKNSKIYFRYV
jgi:hypothetical protein